MYTPYVYTYIYRISEGGSPCDLNDINFPFCSSNLGQNVTEIIHFLILMCVTPWRFLCLFFRETNAVLYIFVQCEAK